ncbi:GTP cyclohydrolase II RibA [Rhodoferax sp.]|uniref:GTP cyclohydrolase II RibA n=1 Tax=Rhodoferax sp. TaxID=50421 RepID=UPI002632B116|nr:GTP cyclohydrolase II RibA [Rhodoferax sp.]MDD3935244.1 GTP cyclohydrolase II RibA [Rhodoferax sp.]
MAASIRTNVVIPLRGGVASFITFNGLACGAEHFAVQFGAIEAKNTPIVRMHSECVTGDVFGSLRCDCGSQLNDAIDKLQNVGGILLYLRQEGRGIGLLAKLDAYKLQDSGLDTYAANRALSLPDDARDYACGAAMLHALGVHRVRLLTNNPDKAVQLTLNGIEIEESLPTETFLTEFNRDYLTTKALLTNHRLAI